MTVTASTPRIEYSGNGVTVAFNTPKFYANAHIKAYLVEDADPTNVTTWVLNTDFTLSGLGSATGTLTATTAPASGYTLVVFREVPLEQTHDYTDADDFPAESHERALDLLTMQMQQLDVRVDRSLRFSDDDTSGASTTLPAPVALYFVRWNSTATGLESFDIGSASLQVPADQSTTAAKMYASATDVLFGRSSSGAGAGQEIPCTAAGRALLDDANAAAQRVTLGAAASGAITGSGLTMATSRLVGRTTASTGAPEEISVGSGLSLSGGSLACTLQATQVRQAKTFEYSTTGTTTNTIPFDDTIPQNTEGNQIFSESFTPTAADSIIVVEAFIQVGNSANYTTVAMFKDSTANAIAGTWASVPGSSGITLAYVEYKETAGSTAARTFSVRYGAANGGNTASVNQSQGGVGLGAGTIRSVLKITEYAP